MIYVIAPVLRDGIMFARQRGYHMTQVKVVTREEHVLGLYFNRDDMVFVLHGNWGTLESMERKGRLIDRMTARGAHIMSASI